MNFEIKKINLDDNINDHFLLYKNNNKISEYIEKRNQAIEAQREIRRNNNFDLSRGITSTENLKNYNVEDLFNDSESLKINKNCFYSGFAKTKKKYGKFMMLGEWFMTVPDRFEDEYVMKLCPFGKHVLVVSIKNETILYNKAGRILKSFKSSLPGGGIDMDKKQSSIFDGIYDQVSGILYILDIINYMNQDYREMTASNRFNWLENFVLESGNNNKSQHNSNITIQILPSISCEKENLKTFFSQSPPLEVDGLLFYWSDGPYQAGSSFFVTWLKPYMVPEVIGLDVHGKYLENLPMDYSEYSEYIREYNEKYAWKDPAQNAKKCDKKSDDMME